jgi:hypothetical protein
VKDDFRSNNKIIKNHTTKDECIIVLEFKPLIEKSGDDDDDDDDDEAKMKIT